ncbi:hypothetical protein K450DRAFT_178854 [Umbelopsis ramanniana AG]|uniref:DNA repair protein RAD50 n=1 Tax=Umbelopsis ramanniana AG TaxID=1314678 RepID=A0AAD5E4W4_UMBRA|nr:uncharacterized protein K450DRAFT_178854 [Umbelopsis ramanniana AG]KAI8576739.1 hypothetical protein K450DRAFT_178854 [Umbelopsis ramanniana AG]
MSSVDKLLIRGIRSFDPENPNVIQFYSPLTLIVGANGSGKTTIIECLKYACTGDLPPNSKGGAFIHDTKLAGKAEVKAQIKLKFKNVRGTHMTCTRSMSLTQTKTTAKLKTLESLLQTRNEQTGETYSISTRCAELDAELPLHLGVPKAILDNVIFCHQEESNWPLSEASILKKKFDEIFSSTKYTKALVNIKDLRKNRNENLRVDTQKLQAMASDKEKAVKIRKTVALMKNEMAKKRQSVTTLDQQMHEVAAEIDSLLAKVQELQSLEAKLEQKVHQMQVTGENRDELAANMKMMSQSDTELERMKEQHQSRISTDEETRKHIAEEQGALEAQLKIYQQQVLDKMTHLGKLQAEKDANEQRIKERKDIILKANQRYSFLALSEEDIGNDDINRFEEKLAQSSDKREELDSEIQLVRSEKTSLEEGIKFTKKQLVRMRCILSYKTLEINQQNIKRLTSQMKEIKASKSEIEYLRQKFEQAQNDLKASRNESLADNLSEQLADKERELRDVDDGISARNDEITVLNKQGDTRAKLSLKKQDRDRLSATMNGLYAECKEHVQKMTGHEPTIDGLEQDVESAEETKDQQLRNANKQLSDLIGQVSSAETKLNIAQADYNKKKSECRDLEEQIRQVCNDERLPDMIADCEAEIQENKSMLSGVDGAVEMYKRFLAAAKKTDTCPLCRRGFHDTSEMDVLVKKVSESIIQPQPQQVRGIKQEIVDLEERLSRLKQAQPSWNKLIQLRDVELDICKNSETELQETKRQLATESEKVKETVHTLEEERKNISNVKRKVEDVVRIKSEIRVLSDEIRSLEEELSISGSTKTIDECSREMEQLADKGRALRRAVKALHDDRTRQTSRAQLLEVKVRDAREELVNMEQKLQTKENLQAQIDSLLNDSKALEPSQSQNDDKIITLSTKIGELLQNLRRFQESSAQEQDELQQEINSMEQDSGKLKSFAAAIQMYVEQAGPDQLNRCLEEKKALDKKVESIKVQNATLASKLAEIEKRLSEVKNLERDLTDNLRYRAAVTNIEKLQVEIHELHRQLQQWDNTSYESHLETLQSRQAELIDKRGGIQGELRQMDDQIERYEYDLKTEYKDIDKLHRKHFIGVRASEMAIADMNKYASALEKAIMRFHALKMEDLNKIIKELWINTYKGGDIDYIEIQSDNDGPASNRSYNYRVMMVQNGVKMQMRGRCSAGQKVLTSIIIRLALAETFCINCGILALDEPTTNLDRDNIESLATSLASIIRVRRKQANFQLIVITHDEEFVDFLGRSDIAEYYYRVHKDDL